MKTSFLDYYKQILEKVSFDYQLLYKEYSKAMTVLNSHEAKMLDRWLMKKDCIRWYCQGIEEISWHEMLSLTM